ncbi:MAG: hypothetical protein AAGC60_13620 [Acidobacteriota bacterium]
MYAEEAKRIASLEGIGFYEPDFDFSSLSGIPDCSDSAEIKTWALQWRSSSRFLTIQSEVAPKPSAQNLRTHLVVALPVDGSPEPYGLAAVENPNGSMTASYLDSVNMISSSGQQADKMLSYLVVFAADGSYCREMKIFSSASLQDQDVDNSSKAIPQNCDDLMVSSYLIRVENTLGLNILGALARPDGLPSSIWRFWLGEPAPADPYLDLRWFGDFSTGSLNFMTENQESAESRRQSSMRLLASTVTPINSFSCAKVLRITG